MEYFFLFDDDVLVIWGLHSLVVFDPSLGNMMYWASNFINKICRFQKLDDHQSREIAIEDGVEIEADLMRSAVLTQAYYDRVIRQVVGLLEDFVVPLVTSYGSFAIYLRSLPIHILNTQTQRHKTLLIKFGL